MSPQHPPVPQTDLSFTGTPDASDATNSDVATMSYERAREELVGVVQRLEAGQVPLEESLTLWERGEALAARCQDWLDQARARLDAVASNQSPTQG
ncbi:exodeoxyribonuclease VII small subunit [Actinomyces trachealis]|uniref:exodeoxyribonuclease VII small subunit n=1 Tax=Actinomyces trachealis TaxID=2763540 RepID=UPI001892CDE6|nr:exodeoxyribonuclease VII small subunit [Actinomyces trachealis]